MHSHPLTCRLQTDVSPGDVVQVNAPIDTASSGYVVSNGGGSLIVDPDQLISGTTVANSISCVRRCVWCGCEDVRVGGGVGVGCVLLEWV